jgi:transposase-like protein
MSKSKEVRRHHTPEHKLAILREYLVERKPVSEVCERHQIAPSIFYEWQRRLFENGAIAFSSPGKTSSREQELTTRVAQLEAKLARKDTVIAEISEELVHAKKANGDL